MKWRNSTTNYGALSVGFHWVMVALIVVVYASMEMRGIFPEGSTSREFMKTLHYILGLSVLALAALRLVVNLLDRTPGIMPEPSRWQSLSARAMHYALYALMLGLPVLGWLLLSASGDQVHLFGIALPPLTAENKALADLLEEIHETLATAGYFLIGGHALAALLHHYVSKDNTLRRMLPRRD
jgi:cytochrome b561